jgi:hypothetical protein
MTTKLKNRLQKMHFQKQINRRTAIEKSEDDKYYEELYKQQTMELLGKTNENISRTTRGSLRPQHI